MSLEKIEAEDREAADEASTEALERAFIDRPSRDDLRLLVRRATEETDDDPEIALALAIGQAWLLGARVAVNTALERSPCRVCGCWEMEACEDGCGWAELGLCTACADGSDDPEACIACDVALKEGDPVYADIGGGYLHAACCGPEREGYVNLETGEPIGPDDPIPEPMKWTAEAA